MEPAAGPAVGSGLRGCKGWSGGRVDAAGVGAAGTGNFGSGVRSGPAGAAGAEGAGAEEAAGICMTLPQVGHFPFLPAAASGALIVVLQVEQLNLIVIRKPFRRHGLRSNSPGGAPIQARSITYRLDAGKRRQLRAKGTWSVRERQSSGECYQRKTHANHKLSEEVFVILVIEHNQGPDSEWESEWGGTTDTRNDSASPC